jgi:Tol biopolymer transport system component
MLFLAALVTASIASGSPVNLVSKSSSGAQGDAFSVRPEISCDGQRIAFISMSGNLDEARPNPGTLHIHLRNRDAGTTQLVSAGPTGTPGAGSSVDPSISGSGRYIAFSSTADGLVEGIRARSKQVYLFDAQTSGIVLVSRGADGIAGNADSGYPGISADGRKVAFASEASNLVAGDTNAVSDVFLFDLASGTIQRASVGASGEQASGPSDQAAISADGSRVAFRSAASNLVPEDVNNVPDVFLRDISAGTTSRVSVGRGKDSEGDAASAEPSLSRDGNLIAFTTAASNLSSFDANGVDDIYVRNVLARTTTLVSRASDGLAGNGYSVQPRISADGSRIVFLSAASSLVPGDANGRRDIFLVPIAGGPAQRINTGPAGEEANGNSYQPAISCDGSSVAFRSGASNLVESDANFTDDVFVVDGLAD